MLQSGMFRLLQDEWLRSVDRLLLIVQDLRGEFRQAIPWFRGGISAMAMPKPGISLVFLGAGRSRILGSVRMNSTRPFSSFCMLRAPPFWLTTTLALAVLVSLSVPAAAAPWRGVVQGDGDVERTVHGRAGQTLTVKLASSNPSLYFNILPPGSENVGMFVGSQQGAQASLLLPADGKYVIRVYLMRNAARRHERAPYTLNVALMGQALAPLPVAQDARVAGTRFHATANVPCQKPGSEAGATCPAGVTRRGRDGTATVELRGARGLVRRVLFVKGEPVAADSALPLGWSRQGDGVTVRFDTDERYEVPDALLTGG
jgi:hypothetical protein